MLTHAWSPQGLTRRAIGLRTFKKWATRPRLSTARHISGNFLGSQGWGGGNPHLAKNERDAPNFLRAALDKTACAPFFKERRMNFREPTKLLRKSGMWGTRGLWLG
jgi:hypothetical protein